jgi:hypothetical protein
LRDAVSIDALKSAMQSCVKERFVQLNGQAIDATIAALQKPAR